MFLCFVKLREKYIFRMQLNKSLRVHYNAQGQSALHEEYILLSEKSLNARVFGLIVIASDTEMQWLNIFPEVEFMNVLVQFWT